MLSPEEQAAIESVRTAMLFAPFDWSAHQRLAWAYGIVVGWTDQRLVELAAKYEWRPEQLEELKRHRATLLHPAPERKRKAKAHAAHA